MDKRIVESIISFLEEKGKLSLLPEIIAGLKKELEKRENTAVIVSAKSLTTQEEKEADLAAGKNIDSYWQKENKINNIDEKSKKALVVIGKIKILFLPKIFKIFF